jgi:hypothetical protein
MPSASTQIRLTRESVTFRGAMIATGRVCAVGLAAVISTSIIHTAVIGTSLLG